MHRKYCRYDYRYFFFVAMFWNLSMLIMMRVFCGWRKRCFVRLFEENIEITLFCVASQSRARLICVLFQRSLCFLPHLKNNKPPGMNQIFVVLF